MLSRRTFLGTAALGCAASFARAAVMPRKLVLIAGTPSHPPGMHEFNAGTRLIEKALAGVRGLETVTFLNGYPKDDAVLDSADAIFLYADGGGGHQFLRDQRLKRIGGLMAKGVGLMCAHYAVEVPKDIGGPEFKTWLGGYYETNYSCNPLWTPEFKEFPKHPITNGVKPFGIKDEWYIHMRFRDDRNGITPILSAVVPDAVRDGPYVYPKGPYAHIQADKGKSAAETMMWATERPDGGRGVGFTGGHFHQNWGEPNFRRVVLNALLWISKVEVPDGGVESVVSADDLTKNLDPKGKK